MQFNLDNIGLILLALWVVIVVGHSVYRTYGQATTVEKLLMVRRLVALAEDVFTEPKSGPERMTYVLDRLVQLFPDDDRARLEAMIEAAVQQMKEQDRPKP